MVIVLSIYRVPYENMNNYHVIVNMNNHGAMIMT